MRRRLLAFSLLVFTATLAGCGSSGDRSPAPIDLSQVHWSRDNREQLAEVIAARAVHGLDHLDFAITGEPGSPGGDQSLNRSALAYAGALARGASDPARLFDIYTVPRPQPDLEHGLAQALHQGKLKDWLASLAPQDAHYRALSKAYLALRGNGDRTPAIAEKEEPLRPGETDRRVPAIARQLQASDYLANAETHDDTYSPAMVRAVKHMQADFGIEPDGVIGDDALSVLNLSDAERSRALAVAMERMRWLVRNPPATRIDVNVAAARLNYWRDGELSDTRTVIVGEPGHETPQLGSPIYRLVANPTWTVPRSIQQREIAGKGSAYLKRHSMTWKNGWIVQEPGPDNSLGLVKFDMQNDHAIYLHDTPAKALFDEVQRQRSHGCVRVHNALDFAALLARDEGVRDAWNQARATGDETFVPLPHAIPVRILYDTVIIDGDGAPVIRADPYGWNGRVASALGFKGSQGPHVNGGSGDIGP